MREIVGQAVSLYGRRVGQRGAIGVIGEARKQILGVREEFGGMEREKGQVGLASRAGQTWGERDEPESVGPRVKIGGRAKSRVFHRVGGTICKGESDGVDRSERCQFLIGRFAWAK